ncbi:synaptic plasticity regulator PANTS isoform X2 [Cynocephalus volans]|uniref:synaptic plasticity regulator PANTS isoform X2 n=1 Tax=Cynocephalus volans TaxID=110931 RepID=UPI002FCAC35C
MAEGSGWRPPRPCEAYRAEWKLCRSAGHFLHHYYVHGERPACEQWRRDLDSCRDWEERRSAKAQAPGALQRTAGVPPLLVLSFFGGNTKQYTDGTLRRR